MAQGIWIARIEATFEDSVIECMQPVASPEAGKIWLTSQIARDDWRVFFDALPLAGREGPTNDLTSSDPDARLRGYLGYEHGVDVDGYEEYAIPGVFSMTLSPDAVLDAAEAAMAPEDVVRVLDEAAAAVSASPFDLS